MLNERFLNHAQLTIFGQSLDGGDTAAVRLHREVKTRFNQLVIEKNRARAAFADDAANVGAG